MAKTIVGLYHSYEEARDVRDALINAGVEEQDVSILAANTDDRYSDFVERAIEEDEYDRYRDSGTWNQPASRADADMDDSSAAEGAVAGGVIGGVGAALLAILVPGLGPLAASGWLVAGLVGLAGGAVVGGLLGALADAGIDEEDAVVYSEGVRRGYVLVSVRADDQNAQHVADLMNQHGAIDTDQRAEYWRAEGWEGSYDADAPVYATKEIERERTGYNSFLSNLESGGEASIPVVEEEVRVGKREVESGGARVETHVTEEPYEEDVTLRRERVEVDRRPVDRPADEADLDAFEEGTVEITARSEEAVVDKQARVVEEVNIRKDVEVVKDTVRETVRRTDVDVVQGHDAGRSAVRGEQGGTMGNRMDLDNTYRTHYESTFASSGRDYDYFEPHYRYGQELASNPSYANRQWSEIEGDVRRDWDTRYVDEDTLWDDVKDAVRSSWESAKDAVSSGPDMDYERTGAQWSDTSARDVESDVDWDANYHTHYQSTYATGGRDYDYYEPHYRYGRDLASNPSYEGRNWSDIETTARSDWERRYADNDTVWDDVKDAVRGAWESAKRSVR